MKQNILETLKNLNFTEYEAKAFQKSTGVILIGFGIKTGI